MGKETQVARDRIAENGSPGGPLSAQKGLSRALPTSRRWFPTAVLLTGLVLTLIAAYYASRTIQLRTRAQFETAALRTRATIRTRFEVYEALLRGTAGFLAVEKDVTEDRFRNYIGRLRILESYPGVQGIGFAPRVPAPEKEQWVAEMHQQGEANFRIWPETERADFYPIAYIEPATPRHESAIGYDMFSESTRRVAMERARDTGEAAASGKVTLVQEIETPKQPGFLIYFPVYQGGTVPETVTERRTKLRGFAFTPFRAWDLFANIFADETTVVGLEIFDGTNDDSANLLFRSARETSSALPFRRSLEEITSLDISGRTWTVRLYSRPESEGAWIVLALLLGGTLLSLMMFYLTRAEGQARREAERSAEQLKESELALRESEERLRRYATELERRVAERTANLAQSIESLEGVLYHVAHDLRAPLRSMASFTNILLEDYAPHLDERGRDYAQRISKAARRMDGLVQDLLAYGRLAHTAVPVSTVSLEAEVNAAIDRFSGEIKAHGATVEVCPPLPAVKANSAVLNQIIVNLLSNALKFIRPEASPHLRICAEETTSRFESTAAKANGVPSLDARLSALDGKFVRLWIEDNGIGIEPKYHERIFRMFERLHGADAYPGTGIGLAIVQKGIERMNGRVGVESSLGAGSRFWVELPAA